MKKIHAIILISLLQCGYIQGVEPPSKAKQDFAGENYDLIGLKGKVINGHYRHPYGLYSIKLPEMLLGARIDEKLISPKSTKSAVVFLDDFGNLVRVEVSAHTKEEMKMFDFLFAENFEEHSRGLFEHSVLAPISREFKGTRIIEDKTVDIDGIGKTYFALVQIPNGSNMRNSNTGKREDSTRAYMMSTSGTHLVFLSTQESIISKNEREFDQKTAREIPPAHTQELYNRLIELRKTYISKSI